MSYWTLGQVIFNLFICATIFTLFWRLRRPPQDDPRLSRGLQLLQTKITVLEDLSDRTEAQVKQLTAIIDQKTRTLQNKVIEAEQQILKMDHYREKAPPPVSASESQPADWIERQRTIEYVKAARMAHSGLSVDQIVATVNLPREQVEMMAKFNRDQLMFDETQLPEWASKESLTSTPKSDFGLDKMDFVGNLDRPISDLNHLSKLESNFKEAVEQSKRAEEAAQMSIMETKMAETIKAGLSNSMETMQPTVMAVKATAQTLKEKLVSTAEDILKQQGQSATGIEKPTKATVKKVIFPRIEKPQS